MVFNEEGCAGSSNIVSVIEIVGDAPTVVIDGDLNLCDGAAIYHDSFRSRFMVLV